MILEKSVSRLAKTRIKTGWCVDGLPITPESTWRCSACDEHVSTDDQTTKGGWFDYDNDGKLGFIHVDCLNEKIKYEQFKKQKNQDYYIQKIKERTNEIRNKIFLTAIVIFFITTIPLIIVDTPKFPLWIYIIFQFVIVAIGVISTYLLQKKYISNILAENA